MFYKATLILVSLLSTSSQSSLPIQSERPPLFTNNVELLTRNTNNSDLLGHNANYPEERSNMFVVQYAPLHNANIPMIEQNEVTHTTIVEYKPTLTPTYETTTTPIPTTTKKVLLSKHLEPHISPDVGQHHQCYNSKANVKVLSSVSRSPGYNVVYREFPEIVPRDRTFQPERYTEVYSTIRTITQKARYIEDYSKTRVYHKRLWLKNSNVMKSYSVYETRAQVPSLKITSLDPNVHAEVSHQQIDQNLNLGSSKFKRQPFDKIFGKYHKMLHLNIARVYGPAQSLPKPPVYLDSYTFNMKDVHQPLAAVMQSHHTSVKKEINANITKFFND